MGKRKGKKGFCYDGIIISSPRLLIELKHDENQYILAVTRKSADHGKADPKHLYHQELNQMFEALYDILVKEHLVRTSGFDKNALRNIQAACEAARQDILEAIEKITGERQIAIMAAAVG